MTAQQDHDLDDIYKFAVQLGKDAGQMLMDAVQRRIQGNGATTSVSYVEKENSVDLVTKTDNGISPVPPSLSLSY